MPSELTAAHFVERLRELASPEEALKYLRYFRTGEGEYGEGDEFMGVRMGQVFALAKELIDMPLDQIERLMESPVHEVRAGAMSIMDKQARRRSTPPERRKELYDLYMRRHDRIDNWDLVDLAAQYVVGGYLHDKPRGVLHEMARSASIWERRTAMLATAYFIRHGELDDAYAIAEILVADEHDLIHKVVGWMLRYAGDKDRGRLTEFLDRHAATMPRTLLRNALEHFDAGERKRYMGVKKGATSSGAASD